MRLRPPFEQLVERGQGAAALLRQGAVETAGGFISALRTNGAVEFRYVPASMLENELEGGDGVVGCR